MLRLLLTGFVGFGGYILYSGLIMALYSMGLDIPGIELSARASIIVITVVTMFVAWKKLGD